MEYSESATLKTPVLVLLPVFQVKSISPFLEWQKRNFRFTSSDQDGINNLMRHAKLVIRKTPVLMLRSMFTVSNYFCSISSLKKEILILKAHFEVGLEIRLDIRYQRPKKH